ncbi:MAG: hypothetical protein KGZ25_01810 [Planctomycetes bacterium]|nr:hypothetical protein [Planctomycetota bacterium]
MTGRPKNHFKMLVPFMIGQKRYISRTSLVYLSAFMLCVFATKLYGVLPTEHSYQKTLRRYLARMNTEDFAAGKTEFSYSENFELTPEEVYRHWIVFARGRYRMPAMNGLKPAAEDFTLNAIEKGSDIMMNIRDIQPDAMAWYTTWEYPGNPFYQSKALKKRAFVCVAVDMIMLDAAHEGGNYRRSDFLGGSLVWLAYVYKIVKNDLPVDVQKAYEVGLKKFIRRLEKWGPTGIHADMDSKAVLSFWYTARAIKEPALMKRAEKYARNFLSKHLHAAGYIDHGGGFDPSYNGISLYWLTWAALATDWDFVSEAVGKMWKLRAYLSLPDADGLHFFGPTHFATTMSRSSPQDQWARHYRNLGAAMVTDEAKYLAFQRRGKGKDAWTTPNVEEMRDVVKKTVSRTNRYLSKLPEKPIRKWQESHWASGFNYAYEYYVPGFYNRLKELEKADSPLTRPPFRRDEEFIKNFADTFLVARYSDYGAIIHTGPLSWWNGHAWLSGFSGGALSAFWTPEGGPLLLGRNFNRPYDKKERDSWTNWKQWQTHAVSGVTADGKAFSTARIDRPPLETHYQIKGRWAKVVASAPLTTQKGRVRAAEKGCLRGRVQFRRDFIVRSRGLTVKTSMVSDGKNMVEEMYELIPAFRKHPYLHRAIQVPSQIEFFVDGDTLQATSKPKRVERIKIQRFKGAALIEFENPVIASLTAKPGQFCQNILLGLLNGKGKPVAIPSFSIRYTIRPARDEP